VVTENAGEVEEDERPAKSRIRFDSSSRVREMEELTTVNIRRRVCSSAFALVSHDTCADARRGNVGAFACLKNVEVLALSCWDGHASIARSMRGFADLGSQRLLELVFVGSGLLPSEPVQHLGFRRSCGGKLGC